MTFVLGVLLAAAVVGLVLLERTLRNVRQECDLYKRVVSEFVTEEQVTTCLIRYRREELKAYQEDDLKLAMSWQEKCANAKVLAHQAGVGFNSHLVTFFEDT